MTSSSHIRPLRPPNDGMDRVIDGRSARRRRLTVAAGAAAVLVAIVAAAAWLVPSAGALTVRRSDIEVAEVRREPFQDYLPLRAEVAPLLSVYVTAVSGGQVEQVLAQDGAQVQVGAPLAKLANPQLQLDVTAREAEIAARLGDVSAQQLALQHARADREQQIDDTGYNLLKARRDVERREALHAAGFESDAAMKTLTDEVAYHQAKLAALKQGQAEERAIGAAQQAQIRQMSDRLNSNLKVVQSSLGALVVSAPAAGRLTNFNLQPGQSLKAGDAVGQVDSEGAYKLIAEIDEFYLSRVAAGQTATAETAGHQLPMRILRVLPQVVAGRFRPNGAWLEASGGAFAFVLKPGEGHAERRAIAVARRNPLQVEVTRGLRPGERVIVSSYAGLEPYKHLLLR